MGVGKYACFMQMYVFIIGNQLTTQNIDKYCPETLTGTVCSITIMCSNHNMANIKPNRQQQLSVCQCADLTITCPKLHGISIKWACQ